MLFNTELKCSILIYFVLVLFFLNLLKTKPVLFFNKNESLKEFGVGKDKTILPLWMAFLIGSFLIYMLTISFIIV